MKSRVVITGVGVVSAIGTGAERFWRALSSGRSGVKPISSPDVTDLPYKMAARVSDFKVRDYISYKGVSSLSRSAQFVCVAARIALNEAGLEVTPANKNDIGVVLGTAFGSASSLEAFEEECLRDGERFLDPMSFPKTVANSPAGCLSILLGAAGLNITISTDFASGLSAVEYAASLLAAGRARIVIAGGYDELSRSAQIEMYEGWFGSDKRGSNAVHSSPTRRERNGFYLGEGAGVLVLEKLEDALARQAPIVAELVGIGTSYCLDNSQAIKSQCRAMADALRESGFNEQDIDCVSLSANGSEVDRQERLSLERLFRDRASCLPRTAIKSLIGECGGASGAIQLIAAAQSTLYDRVTPSASIREGEAEHLLCDDLPAQHISGCNNILINSFNGDQNNLSAVVSKFSY